MVVIAVADDYYKLLGSSRKRQAPLKLAEHDMPFLRAGVFRPHQVAQLSWPNLISVTALVLVGACATPATASRAHMPPVAKAQAETVLEGALEVLVVDSDQGSRTLYFLVLRDRRVPLRFVTASLPNLPTGTPLRVRGRWEKDTFVVTAIERI